MSREIFTDNERIIVNLLRKNRSLSKAKIAKAGGMSWATAVKMTNRLISRGTIEVAGRAESNSKPGKNELLYSLSRGSSLAIGIDVEYRNTRIILTDLWGDILAERALPTPQHPSIQSMQNFLVDILTEFFKDIPEHNQKIIGIGIGLPGIVIPSWLKPDDRQNRKSLEDFLAAATGMPVVVEINARASTNYVKWNNPFFPTEDFIYISIRTGVGMGIVFNGELVIGHQFISGEIGHIKVADSDILCRCGGKGCLETVINKNYLYREYLHKVREIKIIPQADMEEIISGVEKLFSHAAAGEKKSLAIIEQTAKYLGKALASCLMTLFIPNIIVSGNFGPDGYTLLPLLEKVLEKELLPSMRVNLRYLPISQVPFAESDALLAFSKYLDNDLQQNAAEASR
jgi:N-acetylglucosamine repressor